ncbi:MAG: TIGR00730 family Rossman fold protein [Bacteroidota bacterium]
MSKKIAVYCGSKTGSESAFGKAAQALGEELATNKIDLVYGGAQVGLMGIVADASLQKQGNVIGVIPDKLYEMEVAHLALSKLHRVESMHERKALMADLSDAFIALPGGIGTLEEILEMMTWAQIGYHQKPCALLNVAGYYNSLINFLREMETKGFAYRPIDEALIIEEDPKKLLERIFQYWTEE